MGAEQADTLMALLPPVGWADVATKHDVDHLATVIQLEFGQVRTEMASQEHRLETKIEAAVGRMEASLRQVSTRLMFGMLTSNAAMAAMFFTATRAGT